jgi:peptidyl-dipeptidase Dcp
VLDPTNPLAAPSTLPHGLPPFDALRTEHFAPALREGMAQQRAEVEVVATSERPASFENTVGALEASGELLARAANAFYNLVSSHSDDALRAVEAELAPELTAHGDAIHLDARLFARLAAVREQTSGGAPDADGVVLDDEQRAVLERWHRDLARAGAGLDEGAKARLRELNGELSRLTTQFGTELLAATNAAAVHVTDEAELAGLTAGERSAAAQAAVARGLDGWVLPLSLPTDQPVLASLDHRGLRERVFRASTTRGLGGEHDTRALLTRTAGLRAERAGLLGAAHHAGHVLEDATAPSVEAVMELLTSVVPAAVSNARGEALELAEELRSAGPGQGGDEQLRPWDWSWAAARVRARRFSLDPARLKPYFELDAVITRGVFGAATALYGLTFTERPDLPAYHPDVRTWEVFDEAGASVGLFLGDFFARESKRGGAWMSNYVDQVSLPGRPATRPVVVNNLNVPRPADGEPALLTPDEVETAFHEFGHALHGLLSDVRYPRLSGTTVPRDFVEFPSQVNEVWAWDPALLPAYARHVETGEPLPAEAVEALLASRSYGQGFATTEIVAAMLLDQAWHQLAPGESVDPGDVEAFEAAALERHGVALELVPPRYRSTYFNHVFSGGYSAGYYSYLWSEVLDADTVEWFAENGGMRRENGEAFAREVLSRGGTVDLAAAYRAFRGRDPRVEPLLQRRGLAATGS